MNLWLVFLAGGAVTFAMRFSFIYAFGRVRVPERLHRALRFVPPAVLSAIIFPEVMMPAGRFELTLANPRLPAAAIAVAIALWTRKTLPTIAAGMTALLLLQALR
jgi:branched-subunit amino acid transport protein